MIARTRIIILWFALFAIATLLVLRPALAEPVQPALVTPTAGGGTGAIEIPADTQVSVSLKQPVSSSTATAGDVVALTVDEDVTVNGIVVIAKGADGQATVTTVEHAGGNGHGGKVVLTMNWAYAVDGTKVDLASTSQDGGSGDKKGSASTATIASYALLGPIGLFAHNFVHGKDVTIGTDKVFVLYTDHNIDIRPGHAIAPQIPVPVASPTAS